MVGMISSSICPADSAWATERAELADFAPRLLAALGQ